jgi:hypothetical protein
MTKVATPCPVLMPCSKCKELRGVWEFYKIKERGRIDVLGHYRRSICAACEIQKYKDLDPRKKLLYLARKRANASGLECNLEIEDIVIPSHCPVFGTKFTGSAGKRQCPRLNYTAPSLDRIDNTKGYVKGNVVVISVRANALKSDATPDELRALARYINEHLPAPVVNKTRNL